MIIGITGHAGVGKDTFGSALVRQGYTRVALADPVKDVAEAVHPWVRVLNRVFGRERAKRWFPPVRRAYQRLGAAARDHMSTEVWVDAAMRKVDSRTVITDVRFPNEAAAIRKKGGIIIKINRPGYGPLNDHPSESLYGIVADLTIENDGTVSDLEDKAIDLYTAVVRRG